MCGHVNTPVFSSTLAGIRARCRRPSTIKNELGYKLGTGKKNVTWHFFTHGAFRSSQKVVETCPCVPDRNGIRKCLFLRRGRTEITGYKTSRSKDENQQQTQPTYMHFVDARIRTQTTLVGREASALTTAPLRIFVSSRAVHCFIAAAKLKFQTGH